MTSLTSDMDSASSVAQHNQGRGRGLGRGPRLISTLRSPQESKTLKILQCNINGLTTPATRIKLDQLLEIAINRDIQVVAIQETKLKKTSTLKIKGFDIYRTDRKSKGGGGLAFFIRNVKYQSIDTSIVQSSDLEIQGIEIFWRGKPFHIYNVYHPPNSKNLPTFLENFLDKNSIVLGDLNAKHSAWGCSCNNTRGEDILQLMDDNDFLILNDGTPTHNSFSYSSSEALDIAITSAEVFPQCTWSVLDNIGSDHLPILIEFRKRQRVSFSKEKFWNFKKANWDSFRESIDCSLDLEPLTDDLNDNWMKFKQIVLNNAKLSIPRGNVKRYTPFFTHNSSTIKPLIEKRKLLFDTSNERGYRARTEINKINAEIKSIYAHQKRSRWIEMCGTLDARTPNSKLWRIIKGLNRHHEQYEECNSVKDTFGQALPDDKSAADGLAAHYQKISKLDFSSDDKSTLIKARNIIHGCRTSDRGDPILTKPFSQQELLCAMAFLDLSKTPGPDGLHGQMLENLGQKGKDRILDIFNQSWIKGRLPIEWKRATIIPIKKPGKKTYSPGDFRPIALTSIPCKIMEKMILIRVQCCLDKNALLPSEQYGFKRGHSTTDQILYFCQSVRDAQNIKPTHHTVAAFLDLTKAFDRVWKDKLIIKLHDFFKICGNALTWIADFLQHRSIRVKVNGSLSSPFRLNQGVPQGSVLSPTLFTMYIAGIEKLTSTRVKMGLFADDIVLWSSGNNVADIEMRLNNTLIAVSNFAKKHKLSFNPRKSIATFFTTNKRLHNYQPQLELEGQSLTYEKHPKYLGFILDQECTSNKHIAHIVLKARKRLTILKYIAGRDWGADATTLRTTYLTFIRPILEYGFPIYCCASKTNLKKLEQVQLSAARIITGLRHSCPSEIVLYEADLQPLHTRRQASLVKYFNKLSSYGPCHKTSMYLNNWSNHQRLKRNSPFSLAASLKLPNSNIEPNSLHCCLNPAEGLPRVHFHFNLNSHVNKKDYITEHLRQLALEHLSHIPNNAIKIFTDGSKIDNLAGSGIYIETPQASLTLSHRNPDHCSVFRSELIAIDLGLKAILSDQDYGDLWILSDSRSSLHHLSNWLLVGDKISTSILLNLKLISLNHDVHLQWVPSHVNLHGNEMADSLAKEGCRISTTPSSALSFLELYSLEKSKILEEWKIPPTHNWYKGSKPGLSLDLPGDRRTRTVISRLASGHIKCLIFSEGRKTFVTCTKCQNHQASPDHLLNCMGLSREDLYKNPLLTFDFLSINELVDLV